MPAEPPSGKTPTSDAAEQKNAPRKRRPKTDARTRAKAARLEREAGIPRTLAFQVAMGNVSLNEVLERMARHDRIESLMRRHELPKSLATQVAMGQADLSQVLVRRRRDAHLAEHRERSVLLDAVASGREVVLGLLEHRKISGKVLEVDRYEFRFQPTKGEEETIHKLQVKYGVDVAQGNAARSAVKSPKKAPVAEPVWKPQDRYGISDKRLFSYLDDELDIAVQTCEDDAVKGKVTWVGRWEFGLRTRSGIEVVMLRHALKDVREV